MPATAHLHPYPRALIVRRMQQHHGAGRDRAVWAALFSHTEKGAVKTP